MRIRHVFSAPDLPTVERAIAAAREVGVADEDISLIARSDIEVKSVPMERLEVSTDMLPAALRGAGAGAVVGCVAGIVAVAVPAIGITIAGAGLLALIGAAVGGWSSALAGAGYPNPVRRMFEAEIEDGRILVIIDDARIRASAVADALTRAGAMQLPFEESGLLV
ncbi:hypothetical protein [Dokdonella soli]|uniref:DUF1269 domain-containing protein n=1 Tax=Dokdonella soli TaxID=529810 RepID=A0ABP3TPU7_9GAMM